MLLRDWRWHAVRLFERRNLARLPVLFLLCASAALAYVAMGLDQPQVAKLQAELERMRGEPTLGNIRGASSEPASLISALPSAPSSLFAHVASSARSAGLGSIGVSAEPASSDGAERVSLKARGTYVQSKAFLAALLNDTKFVVTQLELRGSEPAQVEVRLVVTQSVSKLE